MEGDAMYPNKYIIEMINDAVSDEKIDSKFYSDLSDMLDDEDDKELLSQMSLDENKHYNMFKDIYEHITDSEYNDEEPEYIELSDNISDNLKSAFVGELTAVEKYRPILFTLEEPLFKNYLYEIITDEQKHSLKILFLLNKYK